CCSPLASRWCWCSWPPPGTSRGGRVGSTRMRAPTSPRRGRSSTSTTWPPTPYWYAPPPLGWGQLAAYIWLTDGFARYSSSVEIGREFMLVVTGASSVLVYLLSRRLGF